MKRPLHLWSEGFKSAHYLSHHIGLRWSSKVRTARPAAERLIRSSNLDHEIGSSFTYLLFPLGNIRTGTLVHLRKVSRVESSTNLFLKLTDTENTNSDTRKKATHHHVYPRFHSRDLNNVAKDEDDNTKAQVPPATPPVRCVSSPKSTKERANAHKRNQNR